jgi:YegS/Rv2252/BmrU family lipid kinase
MKDLIAIINPKSGTNNHSCATALIDKVVDKSRFNVALRYVEKPGDAKRFAQEAVTHGCYGVIAVGGDGTVNGAASGLVNSDVALAVVPCGSGNGLARHLHIPLKMENALKVVNQDLVDSFDYCTLNDVPFMCTCGMGFDAQVAYDFQLDGKRGFPTYVKTALEDYLKFKPQEYKIDIDGRSFTEKAFVIAFGNAAQYGNNGFIAPHASMQDGKVDMTVISPFHVLEVPIMGLSLFFKKIDLNHCVNIYRATTFRIHRFEPGPMHIDGDPVDMPCDVEVKCHPRGIKIFTPGLGENNL